MSTNLDELKDLVAAIKADQQAQKDKEKRDSWTKFVSLSMICLAVLAAVATQRGAGYSSATMKQLNEATFNQAQASDQWAFYQAKGIKQSIYEQERDRLNALGAPEPKTLAAITSRIDRYEKEKKDISAEAHKFEGKRDEARTAATHAADASREMGLATTIFQIAIALGGVCLVVKKRWLWHSSLIAGSLAGAQMARVLLLP
ncbi:MAG: DUF4337 domain-containing protein [Opitutaceae bacterium]|jgi:hypothetical protein|nr:DUF4337 domain-containing protein [Opitutaceae bacterium]